LKKKQLRKSDIRELNDRLVGLYGKAFISKNDKVEEWRDDYHVVAVNDVPLFFYEDEILIPTLKTLLKEMILPTVTVDMGAVKFVTKGADIMRPGITEIPDGVEKDDYVAVVDEKNHVPLAVCQALFGEEMREMESGKVLRNVHRVGDDIWGL